MNKDRIVFITVVICTTFVFGGVFNLHAETLDTLIITENAEQSTTTQNTVPVTIITSDQTPIPTDTSATTTMPVSTTTPDIIQNIIEHIETAPSTSIENGQQTESQDLEIGLKDMPRPARTKVKIAGLKAIVKTNDMGQRGFVVLADSLSGIENADISAGLVSWAFLPDSVNEKDNRAVRLHVFNNFFPFTNNPDDLLIDDQHFVDDASVRIAVVAWDCKTESCDSIEEMSDPLFVSKERGNFHKMDSGRSVDLSDDMD